MEKEQFLISFLKWSGGLEIGIGCSFLFMDSIFLALNLPSQPFFSFFSGITLIFMGFLLYYSARDVERYLIIPLTSCIYRFVMAFSVEIYGIFFISVLAPIFIAAMIYDISSAILTLALLYQLGFLN